MARANKLAVKAGVLAFGAGRIARQRHADPSSPLTELISTGSLAAKLQRTSVSVVEVTG